MSLLHHFLNRLVQERADRNAVAAIQKADMASVRANRDLDLAEIEILRGESLKLRQEQKYTKQLAKSASEAAEIGKTGAASVGNQQESLKRKILLQMASVESKSENVGLALSGNIKLGLDYDEEQVSAAELNAAVAGSYTKEFMADLHGLVDSVKYIHKWARWLEPVLTPSIVKAGGAAAAPTVEFKSDPSATPYFDQGYMSLVVTFDTDEGATKTYQAGTKSTGSFTCVAKANFVDGETVTLEDAYGNSKDLEWDVAGDGVTAGKIQADISGATTAAECATIAAAAITADPDLRMTAVQSGNDVNLTQDDALAAGDTTITETVADAGFTTTDFSGGADRDSVKVTIQIDASDTWLGFSVPQVEKLYYVIA